MTRTTSARRYLAAALASALVLSVAACSSDDGGTDATATTTSVAVSTTEPVSVANECDRPAEDPPEVAPVDGVESDHTMTSFDGTEIRFHWFPTDDTGTDGAPVVLMGPGWGQAGDTSAEGAPLFGALGIASMNDRGYHVLTWDPRGFGESTGKAQVNGPDTEGRDVQLLLDWVAAQPDVLLDRDGDPRTGMVGFSYGGGIQLTLAAIDCRVDAIVPGIAWHSLETSLYKSGITKQGWSQFLLKAAAAGRLAPEIVSAGESGGDTGVIDQHDQDWFRSRGPAELVEDITVPTLIIQGTVDTLFTLDEGVDNFRIIDGNDVPVSMVWFCGGHGACLTYDANADTDWLSDVTFAWLDRYVKGEGSVDLGPGFQFVDQHGEHWSAPTYPDPVVGEDGVVGLSGEGSGSLTLVAEGGAGPVTEPPASDDILSGIVTDITPAKADHAVDVAITADEDGMVLGAGSLTLTYSGTTPDGERPTRIFAQLVDDATGLVLGNQITPIEVVLDGSEHEVTVPLETVAQRVASGDTLTLQLVATTVSYAEPRLGGSIDLSSIDITLPLVTSGLVEDAASDA